MIITYLVFGLENSNYRQAVFSILTFLAQTKNTDSIAIVTDSPDNFRFLSERVTVFGVDDKTLKDWKGKHNFFWRIKIKALQFIASKFENQHILYLDADTFLFGNIEDIRLLLNQGKNLMHTNEGKLSKLSSKTERMMWNQTQNKTYAGITITQASCMWNAGVVAISKKHIKQLNLALDICDEMCVEKVTDRLIEQFALSIAMNEPSQLLSAEKEIGHYWGNKRMWNAKIIDFISNSYMKGLSTDDQIDEIKRVNFIDTPVRIRTPKTRERLIKKLHHFLPDKEKIYIKRNKS